MFKPLNCTFTDLSSKQPGPLYTTATFSNEPGVKDNSQVFAGGNHWDCLGVGWVQGPDSVSDKTGGGVPFGRCTSLMGSRPGPQSV